MIPVILFSRPSFVARTQTTTAFATEELQHAYRLWRELHQPEIKQDDRTDQYGNVFRYRAKGQSRLTRIGCGSHSIRCLSRRVPHATTAKIRQASAKFHE